MKKIVCLLVITLVSLLSFTGCASRKRVTVDNSVKEEVSEAPIDNTSKNEAVLGGDSTDYSDYDYMYPEHLRTETEKNYENGKMESNEVTILIPTDEYAYVNRDYVSVNSRGVSFSAELNPYFQFEDEKYTVAENLQALVDNDYDIFYTTSYKDMVIHDVIELDDNRAFVYIDYLYYQSWNDMYVPIHEAIFVNKLESNLTVMINVEVCLADITVKTQELLDEIEKFYQFEVGFDKTALEEKVTEFVLNDNSTTDLFSTGYMLFELPKGWDEDYSFDEDYNNYNYAPAGDSAAAQCTISVEREYLEDGMGVEFLLEDPEFTTALLLEDIGEEVENVELVEVGDTPLGHTAKFSFDMYNEGTHVYFAFFFASKDEYMYTIYAMYTENSEYNTVEVAENLIATAQVKNYY